MASPNKALLERFLSSLGAGDVAAAAACFHQQGVLHEADVLPYGGDHRGGPEGFLGLLNAINSTYTMTIGKSEVLDAEERVVVLADVTMTSKISSASMETSLVEVFSFADGLIIDDDVFYKDAAAVAGLHERHP
jgi:hypothetical protein